MVNLDLVRSTLSSIAGHRRASDVFGATSHGFVLNPRATNEDLERAWVAGVANGAFPIADLGCAIRLLFIVTGEERNHVWIDDRANDGGIYPASTPGHDRLTFAELDEDWLDQSMLFCESGHRTNRAW